MRLRKPKWGYYGEAKYVDYSNAYDGTTGQTLPLPPKTPQPPITEDTTPPKPIITLYPAMVLPGTRLLNIRRRPTKNSPVLDRVQDFELMQIEPMNDKWCRVLDMKGVQKGFCMTEFLYVDTKGELKEEIKEVQKALDNLSEKLKILIKNKR